MIPKWGSGVDRRLTPDPHFCILYDALPLRRSARNVRRKSSPLSSQVPVSRRLVRDRWVYEQVVPPTSVGLLASRPSDGFLCVASPASSLSDGHSVPPRGGDEFFFSISRSDYFYLGTRGRW